MATPRTVTRSSMEGEPSNSNEQNEPPTEALTPGDPTPPPTDPNDELNNEQLELERAIRLEQEAYRAGEEARKNSIITQAKRSGGDVNHDEANNQGERAAQRARDKALKGRPTGVYVTSPIKVRGEHGDIFAPVGFRLTNWMVRKMGERELKKLEEQELVQDLR